MRTSDRSIQIEGTICNICWKQFLKLLLNDIEQDIFPYSVYGMHVLVCPTCVDRMNNYKL